MCSAFWLRVKKEAMFRAGSESRCARNSMGPPMSGKLPGPAGPARQSQADYSRCPTRPEPAPALNPVPLRRRRDVPEPEIFESNRATRRKSEPHSDAEIERGLREKAVSDPRAAEILLRRLQRPRNHNPPGVHVDAMSEAQVERLHDVGDRECPRRAGSLLVG